MVQWFHACMKRKKEKNGGGKEKGRCPAVLVIALMELPHG
jgi:hypothetical protein